MVAVRIALTLTMIGAALMSAPDIRAAAGSSAQCTVGETCTVGEFLYDDSYTAITSATCTITTHYPDGSSHLTNQSMTANSGGWYSHQFTAPTTTGYYRAQVCCTAGSDYLCLDKSFDVVAAATTTSAPTAAEIAAAVWGYSSRTLSGFGDLISNVWGNSTRTLTKADLTSGSLATKSDVESNTSTTTTTVTNNITNNISTSVANTERMTRETRTLVEQIVNKPVIVNSIEDLSNINVNKKIEEARAISDALGMHVQLAQTRAGTLVSKWLRLSDQEKEETLTAIGQTLGASTDTPATNSVFGQLRLLTQTWDYEEAENLTDQAEELYNALATAQKTKRLTDVKAVSEQFVSLAKLIKKLLSFVATAQTRAQALDTRQQEAEALLSSWQTGSMQKRVEALTRAVLAINALPKANIALSSAFSVDSEDKKLRNRVLAARGLIISNKKLLLSSVEGPLFNLWLEEGSMVFKSLVTNPSNLVSQTVTVQYYLPTEVKKEDILEIDSGLTVSYDTEKNQYYVTGEILLAPSESRTLSVRVADLWDITPEEIQSVRVTAEELAKPLEATAYFAQGVTMKSDIDVSLDKVEALLKEVATPEQKIRSYREAEIEMKGALTKMEKLKELVTLASSSRSLLGFVGGSQALAVWGLIIVLLAGFVFLSLYMRVLIRTEVNGHMAPVVAAPAVSIVKPLKTTVKKKQSASKSGRNMVQLAVIAAVSTLVSTSTLVGAFTIVSGSLWH